MTKEEIEKEWKIELNNFINFHSKKVKGMSPEEEKKYVEENKINEKIAEMYHKFKERYELNK